MNYKKQVEKSHYNFSQYMIKPRWCSVWHQVDEIQKLNPTNVLEVGPGPGLLKQIAGAFDIKLKTLDVDPNLDPDYVGSVTAIPIDDEKFDVVCAFQVLEHLPYPESLKALIEMKRVSRKHVIISLPNAKRVWPYQIHVPLLGTFEFVVPRPQFRKPKHIFDGEHYWEINKQGYSLLKVIKDLSCGMNLIRHYQVKELPYHHYFVFEK